ncbi:MAG: hypothetical protein ACOCUW_05420 [Gemmatimonadota bacterium]
MQAYTESTRKTVTREIGRAGRLVVGGTVSTGLLLGGYTVGILALAGRTNGSALLPTSLGLFLVGAVIGLVVSVAIGLVGREDGVDVDAAIRSMLKGVLFAVPALAVGAVLSGWIAMAMIGIYAGKVLAVAGSALAALVGLGVLAATFKVTCDCGASVARRVKAVV